MRERGTGRRKREKQQERDTGRGGEKKPGRDRERRSERGREKNRKRERNEILPTLHI